MSTIQKNSEIHHNKIIHDADYKKKFIELEADIACDFLKAYKDKTGKALVAVLDGSSIKAEKHNLRESEIDALRAHYEGDEDVANLILDKMKEICPTEIEEQYYNKHLEATLENIINYSTT